MEDSTKIQLEKNKEIEIEVTIKWNKTRMHSINCAV